MPEGPVPYTSIAGCEGPAYIGLSSEQIKAYNEKAKKRRAEEAAAKEKTKEARQQLGVLGQRKAKMSDWWYKLNHRHWGQAF